MQLTKSNETINKKRKIGKFLANASMALLCTTANVAKAQTPNQINNNPTKKGFFARNTEPLSSWAKWSGELGFLGYSETKGRVQALEPAIKLNAEFSGERVWSSKIVYDSLTGASPNGALNSSQPQTFTSPSGKASYITKPGEQPLYDQFKDSRVNIATSWSQPLSRLWKWSAGFNGSNEYDYLSLGLNTSFTKESEDKNKSWTLGLSYTSDSITPVGGVPTPSAVMVAPNAGPARNGDSESRSTIDLLLGYTQVVNRNWILQSNISLGSSNGYMNDPYKFVTIYEDSPGATLGDPTSYIHENRPDSRFKRSLYISSKNNLKIGYLTTSYRFLNDDWGLSSHTLEAALNFPLTQNWRLEPSFRYYKQSAVDFYQLAIAKGSAVPENITSDYRLGDLTTLAPGIKLIRKLKNGREMRYLLRYYLQTGDTSSFNPIGSQIGQDLIPDTDAFIVQIHYTF